MPRPARPTAIRLAVVRAVRPGAAVRVVDGFGFASRNSSIVPHWPHSGQRPYHFDPVDRRGHFDRRGRRAHRPAGPAERADERKHHNDRGGAHDRTRPACGPRRLEKLAKALDGEQLAAGNIKVSGQNTGSYVVVGGYAYISW